MRKLRPNFSLNNPRGGFGMPSLRSILCRACCTEKTGESTCKLRRSTFISPNTRHIMMYSYSTATVSTITCLTIVVVARIDNGWDNVGTEPLSLLFNQTPLLRSVALVGFFLAALFTMLMSASLKERYLVVLDLYVWVLEATSFKQTPSGNASPGRGNAISPGPQGGNYDYDSASPRDEAKSEGKGEGKSELQRSNTERSRASSIDDVPYRDVNEMKGRAKYAWHWINNCRQNPHQMRLNLQDASPIKSPAIPPGWPATIGMCAPATIGPMYNTAGTEMPMYNNNTANNTALYSNSTSYINPLLTPNRPTPNLTKEISLNGSKGTPAAASKGTPPTKNSKATPKDASQETPLDGFPGIGQPSSQICHHGPGVIIGHNNNAGHHKKTHHGNGTLIPPVSASRWQQGCQPSNYNGTTTNRPSTLTDFSPDKYYYTERKQLPMWDPNWSPLNYQRVLISLHCVHDIRYNDMLLGLQREYAEYRVPRSGSKMKGGDITADVRRAPSLENVLAENLPNSAADMRQENVMLMETVFTILHNLDKHILDLGTSSSSPSGAPKNVSNVVVPEITEGPLREDIEETGTEDAAASGGVSVTFRQGFQESPSSDGENRSSAKNLAGQIDPLQTDPLYRKQLLDIRLARYRTLVARMHFSLCAGAVGLFWLGLWPWPDGDMDDHWFTPENTLQAKMHEFGVTLMFFFVVVHMVLVNMLYFEFANPAYKDVLKRQFSDADTALPEYFMKGDYYVTQQQENQALLQDNGHNQNGSNLQSLVDEPHGPGARPSNSNDSQSQNSTSLQNLSSSSALAGAKKKGAHNIPKLNTEGVSPTKSARSSRSVTSGKSGRSDVLSELDITFGHQSAIVGDVIFNANRDGLHSREGRHSREFRHKSFNIHETSGDSVPSESDNFYESTSPALNEPVHSLSVHSLKFEELVQSLNAPLYREGTHRAIPVYRGGSHCADDVSAPKPEGESPSAIETTLVVVSGMDGKIPDPAAQLPVDVDNTITPATDVHTFVTPAIGVSTLITPETRLSTTDPQVVVVAGQGAPALSQGDAIGGSAATQNSAKLESTNDAKGSDKYLAAGQGEKGDQTPRTDEQVLNPTAIPAVVGEKRKVDPQVDSCVDTTVLNMGSVVDSDPPLVIPKRRLYTRANLKYRYLDTHKLVVMAVMSLSGLNGVWLQLFQKDARAAGYFTNALGLGQYLAIVCLITFILMYALLLYRDPLLNAFNLSLLCHVYKEIEIGKKMQEQHVRNVNFVCREKSETSRGNETEIDDIKPRHCDSRNKRDKRDDDSNPRSIARSSNADTIVDADGAYYRPNYNNNNDRNRDRHQERGNAFTESFNASYNNSDRNQNGFPYRRQSGSFSEIASDFDGLPRAAEVSPSKSLVTNYSESAKHMIGTLEMLQEPSRLPSEGSKATAVTLHPDDAEPKEERV